MKRILWALLLAVLFHVFILTLNTGWLHEKKSDKTKKPVIMVSMSYKRKPEPPPVNKITPKIKKERKTRLVEKIKEPSPVINQEKISEPVKEQLITEEKIEEKVEAEIGETVSNEEIQVVQPPVEEAVSTVITEAMPLYRINPEPEYPRMAKKRKFEGTVILSVHVNKEGIVDNLWIFESSGYNMLDNAAMKAVRDWTFVPGKRGDDPIDTWVEIPVRFEIE